MSTIIMSQCWSLSGMSIAQKAVLISLADNANDHGVCWPSIPTIARRVCASERAVQNAIKWLEKVRALRADRTNGRHTSYTVTPAAYAPPQEIHPGRKCTPAADAPPQEMHPTPAADAGVPPQEMHQPPQEMPSNHHKPSKEPSGNRQARQGRASVRVDMPDWLPVDAWDHWLAHRRAMKAPFTQRAAELSICVLERLRSEGHDPAKAIDQSVLRGWTGLFPVHDQGAAGQGGTDALPSTWWETEAGIAAMGESLGRPFDGSTNGRVYKRWVFREAGPGPWQEAELADAARMNEFEHDRLLAYFMGEKPADRKAA